MVVGNGLVEYLPVFVGLHGGSLFYAEAGDGQCGTPVSRELYGWL